MRKKDWMPPSLLGNLLLLLSSLSSSSLLLLLSSLLLLAKEETNLRINIGGLMFEIPVSILKRDPKVL